MSTPLIKKDFQNIQQKIQKSYKKEDDCKKN